MRTLVLLLSALTMLTTTACGSRRDGDDDDDRDGDGDGGDGDGDDDPDPWTQDEREHSDDGESWTVLVYLVADNDLEPFGMGDLEEMMWVGASDDFRFVVQADRSAEYMAGGVGNLDDFTGAKRLVVQGGGAEVVGDLGEIDMADPETLADFVAWGVEEYPADRTALVLWDHGAGWSGFGIDATTGPGEILDLGEIARGIEGGLERGGLEQLSMIGFDACLMSTIEVALAMRPYGEYLVASEELVPGHGWDYTSFAVARDQPGMGARDLGAAIVDGFIAQATEWETVQETTMSVVDLYALDPVIRAVRDLSGKLTENLEQVAPTVARARAEVMEFGKSPDPQYAQNLVDIADLAASLAQEQTLSGAADAMLGALDGAVVYVRNGAVYEGALGLSIYFPPQGAYYSPDYDAVADGLGWREFLGAYFELGGGGGTVAMFQNPEHVADGQFEDDGSLTAWGTLAPGAAESLVDATLTYGVVDMDAGTLIALGDEPAFLEGDVVWATWDLAALTMRQGDTFSWAYTSVTQAEGGHTQVGVPLGYAAPGAEQLGFAMLAYLFDDDMDLVGSTYYLFNDNGGIGELDPEAGSAFVPLLTYTNAETGETSWDTAGDVAFAADTTYDVAREALPGGVRAFMVLTATDYAGRADLVFLTADL